MKRKCPYLLNSVSFLFTLEELHASFPIMNILKIFFEEGKHFVLPQNNYDFYARILLYSKGVLIDHFYNKPITNQVNQASNTQEIANSKLKILKIISPSECGTSLSCKRSIKQGVDHWSKGWDANLSLLRYIQLCGGRYFNPFQSHLQVCSTRNIAYLIMSTGTYMSF